jgi:hypothetical protein
LGWIQVYESGGCGNAAFMCGASGIRFNRDACRNFAWP